ncbi:MAG: histidinol-phosphatase [Alphaproteobacteria bacterium]
MGDASDDSFVEFAASLADASRQIALRYFRTPVEIAEKADGTLVTAADREAEEVMRALIAARFPEHGVIGEELGRERADADYVWTLDPIDGTHAFISGLPLFGTLIGLSYRGASILGVIDHPATDERWLGGVGCATTRNGERVATRACAELSRATLYTTSPDQFTGADRAGERVTAAVKTLRYGTDCYGYSMVASGYGDLVLESGLSPHDFQALAPVVIAAGGIMTDWEGEPLRMGSDGRVVACGDSRIHEQALAMLAE